MLSFDNFDLEEALTVEYYGRDKNNFVDVLFTRDIGRSLKKCGVCTKNPTILTI